MGPVGQTDVAQAVGQRLQGRDDGGRVAGGDGDAGLRGDDPQQGGDVAGRRRRRLGRLDVAAGVVEVPARRQDRRRDAVGHRERQQLLGVLQQLDRLDGHRATTRPSGPVGTSSRRASTRALVAIKP